MLNKTRQKDGFIGKLCSAGLDSQGCGSDELRAAHRTRGFYGGQWGSCLVFQTIDCLVVFFPAWTTVAESGEHEAQRWHLGD